MVRPGAGFPSLNIRLFEQKPVAPDQVVAWGSMSPEMMGLLQDAIGQYLRVLIVGGTGTGKTTILSALTNYIPEDDRIVKIEDPEEIFIEHPHVVALEARPAPPGSEVPPYTITDGGLTHTATVSATVIDGAGGARAGEKPYPPRGGGPRRPFVECDEQGDSL